MFGLRSFLTSHFGKPVDDTPYSFTDDAYLERLARQATAFSDASIKDQPSHHPISFRRKGRSA
jgi:hypothetical protein